MENDITPNPVDGRKHTKEEKLQSYIVSRVEKYLNSKGRNIIGWDEILEGGLAPNATVMSWRGVEGGMTAAKAGHDAIMTPNPYAYLDHYQEEPEIAPVTIGGYNTLKKTYSYNPVPADADSLVKQHIIGVQANCWAEYMPTEDNRDYQIFPRLIAISETGWTPMKKKNFTSFCNRMVEDFQRLEAMGVKPCLNFFDVNINTRASHRRAQKEDAVWLKKGEEYKDETLSVRAFGSTDVGVSFLLQASGKKIFHAGDLNNWHWMDESTEAEWKGAEKNFLHELDDLYAYTPEVDVAMFPVDPRLGKEYMRGAGQFVTKIKTHIFVPMHFTPEYAKANAFRDFAEAHGVRFVSLTHRGQKIEIE